MVVAHTARGDNLRIISARSATAKSGITMRKPDKTEGDDLREEYDFSGEVRGKYARRYAEGANIVILDPDVARVFPDSASVNKALRSLVELANKTTRG